MAGKTTYQYLPHNESVQIGVDNWSMMKLVKPVLYISGPGWSRKLASFNSQAEADVFVEYMKNGLEAASRMANPKQKDAQ
jgi:hypothetical protein